MFKKLDDCLSWIISTYLHLVWVLSELWPSKAMLCTNYMGLINVFIWNVVLLCDSFHFTYASNNYQFCLLSWNICLWSHNLLFPKGVALCCTSCSNSEAKSYYNLNTAIKKYYLNALEPFSEWLLLHNLLYTVV